MTYIKTYGEVPTDRVFYYWVGLDEELKKMGWVKSGLSVNINDRVFLCT